MHYNVNLHEMEISKNVHFKIAPKYVYDTGSWYLPDNKPATVILCENNLLSGGGLLSLSAVCTVPP